MTDSKKPVAAKEPEAKEEAKPQEPVADLLEADDLFEEFGTSEWQAAKDDESVPLWEADWEDENVADDFAGRLKQELDGARMKD
ncbi:hypothetical protein HXX76_012301 [Chlamydomonas incerta]|uniref:26S proteasome complex subunit SEM1 n=1 Tax=Chlamydomonas incerta TaxID=51695 RepID=A0A835SLA7_CHLIN|nr:hypothetical protein HXX76_012301 [Chlamydomonas incerta]|eukprot:KAG2427651.1 hypothetical protein HXX76_012301 [Chlamydomonas incerta]